MAVPSYIDPEMQEIFEGFLVETKELLDNLGQDLMELETDPENPDLLNRIFRSAHTIKGTSSFMGFEQITEITHHGEDILNKLRRGELKVTQPIMDVLLDVHDWIERLVENLMEGGEPLDYQETIKRIEILKDPNASLDNLNNVSSAPKETAPVETGAEQGSGIVKENSTEESAIDSILGNPEMYKGQGDFSAEELELIQAAFAEVNQAFASESPSNGSESEKQVTEEKAEIQDTGDIKVAASVEVPVQTAPVVSETKPAPTAKPVETKGADNKPKVTTETIRVDVGRVEELMDLSGELVLGRNRLSQIAETIARAFDNKDMLRDLNETTAAIDFVTSEIQAAVMRMRMVPVGKLYQKAPRIVRDLSKEFGKKIKLVVKGEETEIDRGIIEELNDPLVHMIRNSCDHGIESTEERIKSGKPEMGTITLDADQEGNAIVLKISDDGKGMDPEKLKNKALEKGLITEEQFNTMSKREALQMIFQPGFSTAAKVTSVSGRGVGMDVVRSNIQKLKGMVDIDSEIGKGSTFTIKLPLTLAIIQGLLIKLHNESYAIPLSSVEEVVSVDLDKVSTINSQEVIRIRQNVLPLIRLDKTLQSPVIKEELEGRYVVVVGLGVHRIGLVVDELLGQQEIVIKSIGEYLGHIQGVAGSTILGDGRVIMIIDIAELVQEAHSNTFVE